MIYVSQNAFRLNVDTNIDLTSASSSLIYIRYFSPTLSTGQFTVNKSTETNTYIYRDFTTTDSLAAGDWVMWAHITHPDNRISIGDPFRVTVKAEGAL